MRAALAVAPARVTLALAFGALAGCIDVELPVGQFLCLDAGNCPDGWTCGTDNRCYERPLACYPHVQAGCGAGQSCYVGIRETYCDRTGPLGEYAAQCG